MGGAEKVEKSNRVGRHTQPGRLRGSHLHVFLLHGLVVRRVLGQVAVGGAEVIDVARSSLHAGGVLHQTGLLASRQGGGLEPQQLCNVLLFRVTSRP